VRNGAHNKEDCSRSRCPRFLETVWQRGCVHVSCDFMQQAVWLIINACYCLLGPTCCCVWNAWKGEAATSCFMRGQNLIHATVQWTVEHASTVHWTVFLKKKTVEAACLHCSVNMFFFLISVVNWFYSHCSREHEQYFCLFFLN
jgi:hypothetical protein